jgi:hypothetical protein
VLLNKPDEEYFTQPLVFAVALLQGTMMTDQNAVL